MMKHRLLLLLFSCAVAGLWGGCLFNPQPEPPADEETSPGGGTGGTGGTGGVLGQDAGTGGTGGHGGTGQGAAGAAGDENGLFDGTDVGGLRVAEGGGGAGGEAGSGGAVGGSGGAQ